MKFLKILALLSAAVSMCGQTPATVNVTTPTACLTSIDLTPIASGTLTVYAPGQNGAAAPFSSVAGLAAGSATRMISGGRIVGPLVLPNPAVTSPTNVGYTFTITGGSFKATFASVFITPDGSGNWNLCNLQAGNYQSAYPTVFVGSAFQGGNVPNATTFGSTVTLNADPTANLQAATKQYVDNHASGTTISNIVFTPTDAATIVATWTTSAAADSAAFCGGQGAVDNWMYPPSTSHKVIITGLVASSSYPCHVTSAGVSSAPQNVKTLNDAVRTPIRSASMGAVTSTAYVGDTLYNFLSSDNSTYMTMDDAGSPGPSTQNMQLAKITNESTLTLSLVNGLTNYGSTTNGTDGPGGQPLSYKASGLFGMGGCLYMFSQRDLYPSGSTPQLVFFGNVISDNCNHGATWNNHQALSTFNVNGSPDGPGISMFPNTTNVTSTTMAWCSFVRYAADDGTNGYLTAGNEIDGANAYVYANCTDGWNNTSNQWMIRTPRAALANLTAGNGWQYWCGPASPSPADFVNPSNWSYSSACKVAIYTATNQTGASDEIFVPGFNYYVLATWHESTINVSAPTVWNFLSGPTPAGPWTSIFTQSFNPQGWYNPTFLHRPIATNSSASSVTADVLFTGSGPGGFYLPSYAPITLQAGTLQTVGTLPTAINADFGGQYVAVQGAAFTSSGHLTSFSFQEFTPWSGSLDVGVCTQNSSNTFTVGNYVTVTVAATTAVQTFNAPTDFTSVAVNSGQYPCFYAPSGNGSAKSDTGGLGYSYSGPFGSIPAGSQTYFVGSGPFGISFEETITVP